MRAELLGYNFNNLNLNLEHVSIEFYVRLSFDGRKQG